jgi:hypothetical protein
MARRRFARPCEFTGVVLDVDLTTDTAGFLSPGGESDAADGHAELREASADDDF